MTPPPFDPRRRRLVRAAAWSSVALTLGCGGRFEEEPHPDAQRLQEVLDRAASQSGAAFALAVHDRKGRWACAAGAADRARGQRLTTEHYQPAYSITKLLAAATVLRLVDRGVLQLEAPLGQYLRDDWLDEMPGGRGTTLRMLLDHTSAIPSYTDTDAFREYLLGDRFLSGTVAFLRLVRGQPLQGEQGRQVFYSDSNYALLGLVIEAVTQAPHGQALRREVLDPLGLPQAAYPWPQRPAFAFVRTYSTYLSPDPARPVDASEVTARLDAVEAPAGGLWATPATFVALLRGILQPPLLSEAARRQMQQWKPLIVPGVIEIPAFYGLGLMRLDQELHGETAFGHPGSGLAYSFLAHLPRRDATFFLTINTGDEPEQGAYTELFRAVRSQVLQVLTA